MKIRFRPDADLSEYGLRSSNLLAIAQKIPGFVSIKGYTAEDGEFLAVAEFENEQALDEWHEHPEHRIAQELGRSKFYAKYEIQVCKTSREYKWMVET